MTYYNVCYAKISNKKTKLWEDDAVLVVEDSGVILYSMDGEVLERTARFKLKVCDIKEGNEFYINSKEILVQEVCDGAFSVSPRQLENTSPGPSIPKLTPAIPFKRPAIVLEQIYSTDAINKKINYGNSVPISSTIRPKFAINATATKATSVMPHYILPKPTIDHQSKYNTTGKPTVDVFIDPYLCKRMRPHQKEGVEFMYSAVMGYNNIDHEGVILADDMGLGKTLQAISLIWTLLKQTPYHRGVALIKRCLVVTPCSLIENWNKEFKKWLGTERIQTLPIYASKDLEEHTHSSKYSVIIISYETLRQCEPLIKAYDFGMVVCDEAHRLKNSGVKIVKTLKAFKIPKIVLLTGTPIQNNLNEFYNMCDLAIPNILGTNAQFNVNYISPILIGREPSCNRTERDHGNMKTIALQTITSPFILRRTNDLNTEFLKPKHEVILFCKLADKQRELYKQAIYAKNTTDPITSMSQQNPIFLTLIHRLRDICNIPAITAVTPLTEVTSSSIDTNAKPKSDLLADSGKAHVLFSLLSDFYTNTNEKVVLVSNKTQLLDIFEKEFFRLGYNYSRLDGTTPVARRQFIVDQFNATSQRDNFVFLLSSKAGGVGINLIGASRLILFDLDWNPANDDQATARIWREGQRREVYIYKLVLTGTIEEKIFQRQIKKKTLMSSIKKTERDPPSINSSDADFNKGVNGNDEDDEASAISQADIKELFIYHPTTDCETHELFNCNCHLTITPVDQEGINNWVHAINIHNNDKHASLLSQLMIKNDTAQNITALFYNVTK